MENNGIDRNTRFIETTQGILSYQQLAPLLAERVANAALAIEGEEFASANLNEELRQELHRRICIDLVPEWAGTWRRADVRVGN